MSTKKCACFTPSGLVYTRLETDGTIARRLSDPLKENSTRPRRSIDNDVYEPNTVDSILKENPSIGHLSFKNEPSNERERKDIKDKIDKLIEETEAFLEAYERTKDTIDHKRTKRRAQHWNHNKQKHRNDAITNNDESNLECKIEENGTVNCSQVIYNDLKAWHTNRLSLEDQIRQLKTKLEDLKEIKRHLKTTKPIIETQTLHPVYMNNHLHNRSMTHDHNSSKEHFRKGRLHRVKPKQRNNTSFEKKFRQSNEYVMPTINANTKDDVFDIQLKNDTVTEPTTINYASASVETEKPSLILGELPKPQITTIITESSTYDQSDLEDKSTIQSTFITDEITTTEIAKQFVITNTKKVSNEEVSTDHSSPVDFSESVNYYNSAIDKVLTTAKTMNKTEASTTTTNKPTTYNAPTVSPLGHSLGPARLDASDYERSNPNRGVSDNMGIFGKPVDVFQRRLHPLFIENEDKHVCYCEENRLVCICFTHNVKIHTLLEQFVRCFIMLTEK